MSPKDQTNWVAALQTAHASGWPGLDVQVLPEVDSTNTQLLLRARQSSAGELHKPAVMWALAQTAGRGRMGRSWQADAGGSLMFSVGCALNPTDWSGLSLAVGLGLAEALSPEVQLKWPNDLWLGGGADGRKLGGILIETATLAGREERWCVVGVGINVLPRSASGLRTPPAALIECWPEVDLAAAAHRCAGSVLNTLERFETLGFAPLQAAYNQRDALRGCTVAAGDVRGSACGVGADGALLVHTASGVRRVVSDEVRIELT